MSGKVIKPKNHEGWKWVGTRITQFSCHPDIVSEFIEKYKHLYSEKGYEILDSSIKEGDMFSNVELLLKPKGEKAINILLNEAPLPTAQLDGGSTSQAITKLQEEIRKFKSRHS